MGLAVATTNLQPGVRLRTNAKGLWLELRMPKDWNFFHMFSFLVFLILLDPWICSIGWSAYPCGCEIFQKFCVPTDQQMTFVGCFFFWHPHFGGFKRFVCGLLTLKSLCIYTIVPEISSISIEHKKMPWSLPLTFICTECLCFGTCWTRVKPLWIYRDSACSTYIQHGQLHQLGNLSYVSKFLKHLMTRLPDTQGNGQDERYDYLLPGIVSRDGWV